MPRRFRVAGVVLAAWCAWIGSGRAAQTSGEYDVKAAYLYNFAKFVEWPPQSFPSPGAPFAICILGQDPFGHALDAIVQGERIQGKPLVVRRLTGWDDAELCQILFVSTSEQDDFQQLLGTHSFPRTLTVGEVPQFLKAGGHISFFLEGGSVRFAVNPANVARTELRISSKLMRVARVDNGPQGGTQ
jgi:hypothetical protein